MLSSNQILGQPTLQSTQNITPKVPKSCLIFTHILDIFHIRLSAHIWTSLYLSKYVSCFGLFIHLLVMRRKRRGVWKRRRSAGGTLHRWWAGRSRAQELAWGGSYCPWLLLGLAEQREMWKGTIGKARRSWEERGIGFGWCHSAGPQLFGPVPLKAIAKRSVPCGVRARREKHSGAEDGAHAWIAHCYRLSYTHAHTYMGAAVRIPWSTADKAEFSKVTYDFQHFQIRNTYNHSWETYKAWALLFVYFMLMQCVCLLSVHYGI